MARNVQFQIPEDCMKVPMDLFNFLLPELSSRWAFFCEHYCCVRETCDVMELKLMCSIPTRWLPDVSTFSSMTTKYMMLVFWELFIQILRFHTYHNTFFVSIQNESSNNSTFLTHIGWCESGRLFYGQYVCIQEISVKA